MNFGELTDEAAALEIMDCALFDFELSAEEVASIDALGRGEAARIGPHLNTFAWIRESWSGVVR